MDRNRPLVHHDGMMFVAWLSLIAIFCTGGILVLMSDQWSATEPGLRDLGRTLTVVAFMLLLCLAIWCWTARTPTRQVPAELLLPAQDGAASLATLGTLASGLAHEVRNPLNSIRFNLRNVQDIVTALPVPAHNADGLMIMLRDISQEMNDLEKIVARFLSAAPTSSNAWEEIEPAPLLEEVLRLAEGPCRAQNIEVAWHNRLGAGNRVLADACQLKQIAFNLILNAQEAMPEGGRLEVRLAAEGRRIVLEVADTGYGIPEHLQAKIFDPFFSTKEDGTGLGLSIVRRLVHELGGAVELESEVGVGTKVRIVLPIYRKKECLTWRNAWKPSCSSKMKHANNERWQPF